MIVLNQKAQISINRKLLEIYTSLDAHSSNKVLFFDYKNIIYDMRILSEICYDAIEKLLREVFLAS